MAINTSLLKQQTNIYGRIAHLDRVPPRAPGENERVQLVILTDMGSKVVTYMTLNTSPNAVFGMFINSLNQVVQQQTVGRVEVGDLFFHFTLREKRYSSGVTVFWCPEEILDPPIYPDDLEVIQVLRNNYGSEMPASNSAVTTAIAVDSLLPPDRKDYLIEYVQTFRDRNYPYRLVAIGLADLVTKTDELGNETEVITWPEEEREQPEPNLQI